MNQIPWYQSRTLWALGVSVLAQLAGAAGKQIDPAMQGTIVDLLINAASVVSAAVAAYYRIKTTSTIITPSNPVAPKGDNL